jgi:hypothetical protein
MGAWLAGPVCMSVVATENFYTIDRLLAASPNAAFSGAVQRLGQPLARDLLRYVSSELNRLYFQWWNLAQLAIGGAVLWLMAGSRTRDPAYAHSANDPDDIRKLGPLGPAAWAVVAMLASVVLMLVWLTPAIVSLGRSLDFIPRDPPPPGLQRFWTLHAAYTSLEMIKLAMGILVVVWIARAPEVRLKPDTTEAQHGTSQEIKRSRDF